MDGMSEGVSCEIGYFFSESHVCSPDTRGKKR